MNVAAWLPTRTVPDNGKTGLNPAVFADLNLTAFGGKIVRSWTIFPAFFRRSV
jgi:hypothetical protein